MADHHDTHKKRGHSCFEWIQLIATISIPIIIAIYTIIENNNSASIAADNNRKDREIANNNRRSEFDLSQQSQQKERDLAADQQQEDILVKYQTFLSNLILQYGKDLEKSSNVKTVLHFMTLTALNQLDIRRKRILIRSLHDANLITYKRNDNKDYPSAVTLASIDFKDITFGSPLNSPDEYPLHQYIHWKYLWLPDAILTNASFRHTNLECATFTRAHMDSVDFSFAIHPISKCFDDLREVATDFTRASLVNANLRNAKFRSIDFSRANLTFANMRGFSCEMCKFSNTILFQADLSLSYFYHSLLINQSLVDFSGVKLKQADIHGAYFRSIDFQYSDLSHSQLSRVTIRNSIFSRTTMKNCSFIKSVIQETLFENTILNTIDFSYTKLYNVTFNNSNMTNANFSFIKCVYCAFINVKLEETIFNNASLLFSKFINCSIHMNQLDGAIDLLGSTLSNGTNEVILGTKEPYSNKTIYNIRIQTGDEPKAGTDADVFLQMLGEKNSTNKLQLQPIDFMAKKFEKGRMNEFTYEFDDLGEIKSVIIGHNEENPGEGWYLDWIEIDISMRNQIYRFPCYCWLDKDQDDGEIVRQLTFSNVTGASITTVLYVITVTTGDKDRSGTNANVFLTIYGDRANSGERELKESTKPKSQFEQGKIDTFHMHMESLGTLREIYIRHDNTGFCPGWYLEHVMIRDSKANQDSRLVARRQRQFDLPRTISQLSFIHDEQIKKKGMTDQIPLEVSKTDEDPLEEGRSDIVQPTERWSWWSC
ncbi:unnamed protein product [Adineta ricciae]|uniref:PLAT domain-containing protein n=1 Tax=Adineta ricciae TaxID=249248 RepID=A0A815UC55_ADIRI|nr:unnamed protein product [Adineta ricciae]